MNSAPKMADAATLLMRSRGVTYDESWLLLKRQPVLVVTANETARTSGQPKTAVIEGIGPVCNSTLSLQESNA